MGFIYCCQDRLTAKGPTQGLKKSFLKQTCDQFYETFVSVNYELAKISRAFFLASLSIFFNVL